MWLTPWNRQEFQGQTALDRFSQTERYCLQFAPSHEVRELNADAVTGRLFYALVVVWAVGIVIGGILGLPYLGRKYVGVTLPLYCGLLVGAMTVCDLVSGAIWRGRARRINRHEQPTAYWISIGALASVAAALLLIGIRNWLRLTS